MIIRHQGRTLIGDKIVSGYVVCADNRLYIYQDDGTWVVVKKSSVVPILNNMGNEKDLRTENEYGHPLCLLDLSEFILSNIRARGVANIEDLEKWTYDDFKKIKGLGVSKIHKIQKILEQYGIENKSRLKMKIQ